MNDSIIHAGDTLMVLGKNIEKLGVEHHEGIFSDFITSNLFLSLAIIVVLFVLVFVFWKKIVSLKLGKVALCVWLFGFGLYIIGFSEGGTKDSPALFLRAALSSLEMFVSHSDLIEVRHECHENFWYMLVFSIVHFAAVLLSAIFILRTFFYKMIVKIGLRKRVRNANNVYIFWGINKAAKTLANNIKDKENNLILFFKKRENNHNSHRLSFINFFGINTIASEDIELAESVNGLVFYYDDKDREKQLSKILGKADTTKIEVLKKAEKELQDKFIAKCSDEELAAGRKKYRDALKKIEDKKFSIFVLSDDEQANFADTDTLLNTECVKQQYYRISIYCHAHRSIENIAFEKYCINKYGVSLELIDSSMLSVQSLIMNGTEHPVNFVDYNEKGVVTSDFNALVLGFGETSQEALSFLYEYGAFLGEDGKRSNFHCSVIDNKMDTLKGTYLSARPALKNTQLLMFQNLSVGSVDYWQYIDHIVEKLNYVVVALGDDNLNIASAIELFEYCNRKRNGNLEKFKIYVRVHDDRNSEYAKAIEDYYELYDIKHIYMFGSYSTIFTEDIIIKAEMKQKAERYYNTYEELNKKGYSVNTRNERRLKEIATAKNQLCADNSIRRRGSQDLSNAYHIHTKAKLMGLCDIVRLQEFKAKGCKLNSNMINLEKKDAVLCYSQGKLTDVEIPKEDLEYEILVTNMAKLEHLRWNAAHEMLGYTGNPNLKGCDETTKEHNCLVSWEQLIERWETSGYDIWSEYRQYDYVVVDTTIKLYEPTEYKAQDQ